MGIIWNLVWFINFKRMMIFVNNYIAFRYKLFTAILRTFKRRAYIIILFFSIIIYQTLLFSIVSYF